MKQPTFLVVLLLALFAAACSGGGGGEETTAATPAAPPPVLAVEVARHVMATLAPKSGSKLAGTAKFTESGGMVTMVLEVENVKPGPHAYHLHEIGDCSAPDASSAGGHWNPTGEAHGKWDEHPFHLGDVGNVEVDESGKGSLTLTTAEWSIGTGQPNDIVGRAVIVHAGVDDFKTQPTGAAGGRIGCGVIEPGA